MSRAEVFVNRSPGFGEIYNDTMSLEGANELKFPITAMCIDEGPMQYISGIVRFGQCFGVKRDRTGLVNHIAKFDEVLTKAMNFRILKKKCALEYPRGFTQIQFNIQFVQWLAHQRHFAADNWKVVFKPELPSGIYTADDEICEFAEFASSTDLGIINIGSDCIINLPEKYADQLRNVFKKVNAAYQADSNRITYLYLEVPVTESMRQVLKSGTFISSTGFKIYFNRDLKEPDFKNGILWLNNLDLGLHKVWRCTEWTELLNKIPELQAAIDELN